MIPNFTLYKKACLLIMVSIFSLSAAKATTYYSSGNNVATTLTNWWTATNGTGSHPGGFTTAADVFIVQTGNTYTMGAAWTIAGSLQVQSGGTLITGTTSTWTLTVSTSTTIAGTLTLNNTGAKIFTGAFIINATGTVNETAIATLAFANSFQNDGIFNPSTGVHTFSGSAKTISGAGTISIPNVAVTGTISNTNTLSVTTALTGTGNLSNSATGILNIGGSISVTSLTTSVAGNTVRYTGGAQAMRAQGYSNLTVSGSGSKTGSVSVNGTLSMEGTATIATAVSYGSLATLIYDGSGAQTTSAELITSFGGSGGMVIDNPLGVTLNSSTTLTKLTINDDAVLVTNSGAATLTVSGATSISGTFKIVGAATKTFNGNIDVTPTGLWTIDNTSSAILATNISVAAGGIMQHYVNYSSANVITMSGDLSILGTYDYTGFAPAIFMTAGSGTTHTINTGTTSLFYLLLRTATYNAAGPISVDGPFYAMWNTGGGVFHTNGKTITAGWGIINSSGTFYIDGGSTVNIGGNNGGLMCSSTVGGAAANFNMVSGTLSTPALTLGLTGTEISTFTHSGGSITTPNLTIGNGSTFTLSGAADLNVGTLAITSGTMTTASTGTPSISVTGDMTISAGATFTNIAACSPDLVVNGNITNTGIFTPTGTSTINLLGNWTNNGTSTATGGTVTFSGTSDQTIGGSSTTTFGSVVINPSSTTTVGLSRNSSILGNLTVSSGFLDLSTFTFNRTVAGGTFSLAGNATLQLEGAANFPANYSTINLNPAAVPTSLVEYYGTVAQAISAQAYGNLTLSNNSTKTAAGILSVKGNLNINSSAVFAGSSFAHSIGGNWYNNSSSSGYSSGTSTFTFNGSAAQAIGGTSGTIFNNLTINNASNVSLSQDQAVNNNLNLTAGKLILGSNNLTLGATAGAVTAGAAFSSINMIVADGTGELRKKFAAIGSYFFPIGDNTGTAEYSPVTLNFTAGTFVAASYAGVGVTSAKYPANASTTDYLKRYWTVSNSGITSPSFTTTGTFLLADVAGTLGNIAAAKYSTLPWTKYAVLSGTTLSATAATNTGTGIVFSGISNAVPVVSITGGGVTVCSGTPVSLSTTVTGNGTGTSTYSWSPTTGLSNPLISNPVATLSATTTYTLTVTDGNGITSTASTTITIDPVTVGGSVTGNATVCSGSNSGTVTLSGQTGSIVRWESSPDGTAWTTITNTTTSQAYTNLIATTYYRAVIKSGTCSIANSSAAIITVDPVSIGGTAGTSTNVCSGTNSGTVTLSGQTGTVVRWESSPDGTTWTPITNTTTSQAYTNLTATTYYRAVVKSGTCSIANSVAAVITVDQASVGGTVATSTNVCYGSNSGTLTLSGQTGTVVRWESSPDGSSWTTIANTTGSQAYTNITTTTYYRAVVKSGACSISNSNAAIITVDPLSIGGTVGTSATGCSGTNSGTLTLTGQTGAVLRWESSPDGVTWTTIANTTTSQAYTNITTATYYRAVVKSGTCSIANSTSGLISLDPLSVGGTVSTSTNVCSGTNSGTVTLAGQTGTVVRWESSPDGATWTTIANTTTSQAYTNLITTTYYRAVVKSGACSIANSISAIITVDPVSVGGTVGTGANVCLGTNSGTLTLTGQTGTVVRWESSPNGTSWTTIANTTTSQAYTNLTTLTYYRAVVKSGTCSLANSASAIISIDPLSVGGSVGTSTNVCSGSNSGTVTLSGQTGTVIRWESSPDGSTWTTIANTTSSQAYINLLTTTYYRAVVKSGNCSIANSVAAVITVDPVSIGGAVGSGTNVCNGSNSGTLTLSGQTGTVVRWESSPDGSTWTTIANTTTSQTYTNLTTTRYYRAVVKSGTCSIANSAAAIITIDPVSVGGTVSGGTTVCSGANGGTLTLAGQTGTILRWESSPDGSTWTAIANTTSSHAYSNLITTTYYRAVVKSGTCSIANSVSATIIVDPLSAGGTAGGSTAVCSGTNTGTVTLIGYTGTIIRWESSPDGLTWSTIANTTTSQSYTNLTVTTYYRAVVKSGTCSLANSGAAIITVTALPSATIAYSGSPYCYSGGTATVSFTGTLGGTYSSTPGLSINSSNGTITLATSTAGTYTVTYTLAAAGGCSVYSTTTTVTIAAAIANNQLDFTNGTHGTICATAGENGTATLSAPSGTYFTTINFASYGTPGGTCGAFTVNTACHAAGSPGIVQGFLLGNNSAAVPATNAIFTDPCSGTVKNLFVQVSYTQPICSGASAGTLSGTTPTGGTGTFTYLWESSTTSATAGFSAAAGTNNTRDYTTGALSQTTWYRRTVTSACSDISPVLQVTVVALPSAPTASVTAQPTCATATGTITITAPAAVGMTYSTDGVTYTNTNGIFSGMSAGAYNLTAKNSNGCISPSSSVTVNTQPATPATPTASVTAQPTCATATGTITITAPTAVGMTYSTDGVTYTNTNGLFSGMAAGTYSLTAKNSIGCISTASSVTVNAQPATPVAPTASITAQPTCATATGTITITAPTAVGMTYSTDGITYTNTTGVFAAMIAGTYNLTAKNSSGCISTSTSVAVNTQPATPVAPTATVTAQPTCATATGTITITAPTAVGMTYSTDGVAYTNTNGIFSGMAAGTYSLTAKNSSGCISASSSVTVNAQPATPVAPTASVTAQPTCATATGTITITAPTGVGMTYSRDGATYTNTNGIFTAVPAGSYNLTAKNSNGCVSSITTVTVNAQPATPVAPTASVTAQPTCATATGTISITAPTAVGMTYSRDGSTYTNTNGIFTAVPAGSYNLTAKNSSGCVSSITTVTVNAQPATPATPTASVSTQPTCATSTGTITITAPTAAGMTYSRDGSTYTNTNGIFTAVPAGTYNLTAKNSSGCVSSITTVTVNAQPATPATPTASVSTQPICATATGTITITAPTAAGMTYSRDGSTYTNTNGIFTAVPPGTYNLTAKNSVGCISSVKVVTVNAQPAVPVAPTATVTSQPTCAVATGTITITAPTAVGMTYSSDGTTYSNSTGIFIGMAPGTYNLTAKASSGCISAATALTVNAQPVTPSGNLTGSTSICNGNSTNLTIAVTGSGTITGTLSDGTAFSGTAPAITISVSPVTTTTYTITTLTNGSCSAGAGGKTGLAIIVVSIAPSVTLSYAGTPFCTNSGVANVIKSGSTGGIFSVSPSGALVDPSTGALNVGASAAGIYAVNYTISSAGGCPLYTATTNVVINPNTWNGSISSDWNNPLNWMGHGTIGCPDFTIPGGMAYQPIVTSGTISVHDLHVSSGALLTLKNSAVIQVSGVIDNSGNMDMSAGSLELNGTTAQTIPAGAFNNNALFNLTLNNPAGVTLGGQLDLYGSLLFSGTGRTLYTNDLLTFRSTASHTANLGIVTGNTIIGKASVERYINTGTGGGQHVKGWQLLAAPTNGQTLKQSWMENGVITTTPNGYGAWLSGLGGTTNGYDVASTTPSLKYYNPSTDSWVGVTNPSTTQSNFQPGYMVFIRGDRSVFNFSGPNSVSIPTVMRTKGTLNTGTQSAINIAPNNYQLIGNPYASGIDFSKLTRTGVKNQFYVWDPTLMGSYGLGGYQTIKLIGSAYVATPGTPPAYTSGGYYDNVTDYRVIQSGSAFFVHAGLSGGTVQFDESVKSDSSTTKLANRGDNAQAEIAMMSTSLLSVSGSSLLMADGNRAIFDASFSNAVDEEDALKINNSGENFGLRRDGKSISVESRSAIGTTDTLYYNMTYLRQQAYKLMFVPQNLDPTLTASLVDKWLNTRTAISITDTSFLPVNTTADAGSRATDRFSLVFNKVAGPLPVTFTTIAATRNADRSIRVNWKIENELNIQKYVVERSADGKNFNGILTAAATNVTAYTQVDLSPLAGDNYYRIKAISNDGKYQYSATVKVAPLKTAPSISVYPNPVVNKTMQLQFVNVLPGKYQFQLTDKIGQVIYTGSAQVNGSAFAKAVSLDANLAAGNYQLQVSGEGSSIVVLQVVIRN